MDNLFFINNDEISVRYETPDDTVDMSLHDVIPGYVNTDGQEVIKGVNPITENTWEVSEDVSDWFKGSDNASHYFVKRGYLPRFRFIKELTPGTYYLTRTNASIVLRKDSTSGEIIWQASLGDYGGVVPHTLLLELQGAGGGGGGHDWFLGGGGGGSGGFAAGVLILHDNYIYRITVGQGGVHGEDGSATVAGKGGDTTIYYAPTPVSSFNEIIKAGGGYGGYSPVAGSGAGTGGAGGSTVIAKPSDFKSIFLKKNGTLTNAIIQGYKGGDAAQNGTDSISGFLYCTHLVNTTTSYNIESLASYFGGLDGGGGASQFAEGAIEGVNAEKGAGGGGARGASAVGSSNGGDGFVRIYY